jgi:hypothetical protein
MILRRIGRFIGVGSVKIRWATAAVMSRSGATFAVFLFSVALMFLLMNRTVDIYDEGLVLTNVMRTLSGDVVHRDYYSPYGAGYYYILAAVFKLSDNHFIAARIVGISVMAGIVSSTFQILIARTRLVICLCFTGIVGAWLISTSKYLYPIFPCLLLSLIGSSLVLRSRARREAWPLFLAGCCTGAAALFRYDGGFLLLLAHLTGLAILIASDRSCEKRLRRFVRDTAIYGVGVALVFLPAAAAFVATGSLAAFAADIVDYPLHYYRATRGLPFPGLPTLIRHPPAAGVYLPLVATFFAIFQLAILKRFREAATELRMTDSDVRFLVLFTVLTIAFFYKGLVRVSPLHMMMAIVPANLLLAVMIDRWWKPGVSRLAAIVTLTVAVIPCSVAIGRELVDDIRDPARTVIGRAAMTGGTVSGATLESECLVSRETETSRSSPDYAVVANYLRRFSTPDERIFVGLNRHDKIFVNSVGLYFLADRLPGTHWAQFDPGLQTRRDIQQQMIADLVRNQVRWVVRDASFDNVNEPNDSSRSSGVHDLDDYLSSHYRPVARAGQVEIWLSAVSSAPRMTGPRVCMPQPIVTAMR